MDIYDYVSKLTTEEYNKISEIIEEHIGETLNMNTIIELESEIISIHRKLKIEKLNIK